MRLLLLLVTLSLHVQAKFEHLYPGLVQDGLRACLSDPAYNLTESSISRRENCQQSFACIMNNIDNSRQTILAAGTSALSFIPTALTLLGNRRSEIMAIHVHYPFLALLLTITGISTAGDRVGWLLSNRRKTEQDLEEPSRGNTTFVKLKISREESLGFVIFHVFAALAASAIMWQSYDLALRAVFSWACWTNLYPLMWPCLGVVQYLLDVAVSHLTRARPRHANALKAFSDTWGIFTYLYATIIFSSLTLVSGANAIKVVAVYAFVACMMRVGTAWALDVINVSSSTLGKADFQKKTSPGST